MGIKGALVKGVGSRNDPEARPYSASAISARPCVARKHDTFDTSFDSISSNSIYSELYEMNTPTKPTLTLSASFLGPVFSLQADLTKYAQNLVFARNGTGKSFLSRALRYLDLHGQDEDITHAAVNLTSDETPDGKGFFSISRGSNELGKLELDKNGDKVSATLHNTIFHVFSEDFVQAELRERQYEIDGEIENQIAVDSDNIKIDDTQAALAAAQAEEQTAATAIRSRFDSEKIAELHTKAAVNKQLKNYKELTIESLLENHSEKPDQPEQTVSDILKDLDSLKALPAEPEYPIKLSEIRSDDVDIARLESSLSKITSPSSVSEDIKTKIDAHHSFYETGIKIIQDEAQTECPFCEQGITDPEPRAVIDAYLAYFEAEEEKHKTELRELFKSLQRKESELSRIETELARQKTRYDALKDHIPSKKDNELSLVESELSTAREAIITLKNAIKEKAAALSTAKPPPPVDLIACIESINAAVSQNNQAATDLENTIGKANEERKSLQRKACSVFEYEFAIDHWHEIIAIRAIQDKVREKSAELIKLEKSNPSKKAKERVAETFELLLKEFFADKYALDRETFLLKRGAQNMDRGPHRTLSDGEKAAIAFCYFVACVHRKVKSNSDYRKLFLVFDDPVTSMSYDYVFAIAQTLKNLNISNQGEVSINPGKIDGNKSPRPELLLLTHSSYFFNLSRTNAVVKPDATFSLHNNGTTHQLVRLQNYVAPFEQQLEHVYRVANGDDPDHGTGNAIRSVLEAIGRFCRPDTGDLQSFITFLASEEELNIKSILINSLSHGTYYDEAPPPDDITLACKETLVVVERFAVGHLRIMKQKADSQTI